MKKEIINVNSSTWIFYWILFVIEPQIKALKSLWHGVELTLRSIKKNNIANELVVVQDGAEALDFLFGKGQYVNRNTEDMPALILLDLKLPKIDGIEVLKQIRANARTKLLPVIILTSSKEELDIMHSYESGCNSYVRKPVAFEEFSKAILANGTVLVDFKRTSLFKVILSNLFI